MDAIPDPILTPAEARLEAVVQPLIDRLYGAGLGSLRAPERTVVLAYMYVNELNNGGLMQFFHNSPGDFAVDTVLALQHLGAREHAAALEAATRFFPAATFADGPDARMEALEGLSEAQWLRLSECVDRCEGDVPALEALLAAFLADGPGRELA